MTKKDKRSVGYPANVPGFLTPPILWALYFVLIYSTHGAGCAAGMRQGLADFGPLSLLLGASTLIAVALQAAVGVLAYRAWRRIKHHNKDSDPDSQASFLAYTAFLNAALFFVATIWIGLPILILEPCAY